MRLTVSLGLFSYILLFTLSSSDRVLFLFPFASKSHRNVFDPLINALADRGHELTVITPFASKSLHINVEEVVPLPADNFPLAQFQNPFEMRKAGKFSNMLFNMDKIFDDCNKVYENQDFKKAISQKYDLVIMNAFMNTCFDGVLHKIGAPHILISSMAAPTFITQFTGNHLPSSFVPNPFFSETDRMNFRQRLFNYFVDAFFPWLFRVLYLPKHQALYRKHLGEDTPGIYEIHNANLSLILMNSHYSMNFPRPNMPDNIEVGGMHCGPPKPLPADLEEFASGAKDGFIYFSLGSIVQGKNMPEEYRKIFVKVFGKLKQRVLWKWETDDMADLPSNVKLSKWLPQQDILGHPNIRLFMTHGGLLSTQEAVYHGVPLLGIPMFGDQDLNMKQAEAAGYAIHFEILDITEELLEEKLNLLLNNPAYNDRAKYLSAEFRDQLETPVERAVYWSEYVMRHKGARHLRSASRDLTYLQYHSVDVIGFLLFTTLTGLFLITFTCMKCGKYLFRICKSSKDIHELVKKKKK